MQAFFYELEAFHDDLDGPRRVMSALEEEDSLSAFESSVQLLGMMGWYECICFSVNEAYLF